LRKSLMGCAVRLARLRPRQAQLQAPSDRASILRLAFQLCVALLLCRDYHPPNLQY
jgi:hypothetical protein